MKAGQMKDIMAGMEQPVDKPSFLEGISNRFKKGKLLCIFIQEDQSRIEVYKKLGKAYFIEHKKRLYQLNPSCIIYGGKNPMVIWYHNNPVPLKMEFQITKLTSDDLKRDPKNVKKFLDKDIKEGIDTKTYLDAEALHTAFSSTLIKGLYAEQRITGKVIIIILVCVLVFILIMLQATGTVDIWGAIQGTGGK